MPVKERLQNGDREGRDERHVFLDIWRGVIDEEKSAGFDVGRAL